MADREFVLDLQKVMDSLENEDVFAFSFPALGKVVAVDTRTNDSEGPHVFIASISDSSKDRITSLGRLRPGFPSIRRLAVIMWPRYVDSLVTLGIWDRVVTRLLRAGHEDAIAACDTVIHQLRRLEKTELAAVVSGEGYQTIWPGRAD